MDEGVILRVVRVLQLFALTCSCPWLVEPEGIGSSQYFGLSVWYLLVIES